jgi:hypothetical protein
MIWYTGLEHASFAFIVSLNVIMFIGISGRMVASFALNSALPGLPDRGAYMAISSSLQQLSGGIAAWVAGLVVRQANPTAPLENYATLGFIAAGLSLVSVALMYNVQRLVTQTSTA